MKGIPFVPYYILWLITCFYFGTLVLSFQIPICTPNKTCLMSTFDSIFDMDGFTEWGLTREPKMVCATAAEQVVLEAFDAIAGTLYSKQKLDPAIASNARSNSLYSHRPLRSSSDSGRIGIEIEGAELLFPSRMTPSRAQRRIALLLAAKLSKNLSWKEYEDPEMGDTKSFRPVGVLFNSIKIGRAHV